MRSTLCPDLEPQCERTAPPGTSGTGSRHPVCPMPMTAAAAAGRHIRIATPWVVPDDVTPEQQSAGLARSVAVLQEPIAAPGVSGPK